MIPYNTRYVPVRVRVVTKIHTTKRKKIDGRMADILGSHGRHMGREMESFSSLAPVTAKFVEVEVSCRFFCIDVGNEFCQRRASSCKDL